jgi:hypothetical protein
MPPLPRHCVHYTDHSFERVDLTQVFRVALFACIRKKIGVLDTHQGWLMSNCIRYRPGTLGEAAPLSEKGCIQLPGKFFFAHMNCLDCKKLLSCLAVLWKGLVLQFTVRLTIKDIGLIGVNKTWQGAMVV